MYVRWFGRCLLRTDGRTDGRTNITSLIIVLRFDSWTTPRASDIAIAGENVRTHPSCSSLRCCASRLHSTFWAASCASCDGSGTTSSPVGTDTWRCVYDFTSMETGWGGMGCGGR
jgi:hypothetical protein